MKKLLCTSLLGLVLAAAFTVNAQSPEQTSPPAPSAADAGPSSEDVLKSLGAQQEGVGKIGNNAEIDIPEGFIFFGKKGAQTLLKQWGNLINDEEEALIIHDATGWSVLFEFSKIGYVKDDEKDDLNADKLLKTMQDAEPAQNEARKAAGLPPQHTLGFVMPPKYNEKTNNLEWAMRFKNEGDTDEFVNYNTKLLGREGVMNVTLMVEPDKLEGVLPEYEKLLSAYRFTSGHTYAEYRSGDKLATYGMTGLILGGAGFAAAKTGLLAKLGAIIAKGGKAVFAGIAVIVAGIWKVVGKFFGRRDQSTFEQ